VEISCRRLDHLTILDLEGHCEISSQETEVERLRTLVARLVAEGRVHVAANLEALQSVDARGLGVLLFMQRTLRAAGGELSIVAPNRSVRRMFSATRLDGVLRLFESETEVADAVACTCPSRRGSGVFGLGNE
jgi:anti-anti-sigma factor